MNEQLQAQIGHIDRIYESGKNGAAKGDWGPVYQVLQEFRNIACEGIQDTAAKDQTIADLREEVRERGIIPVGARKEIEELKIEYAALLSRFDLAFKDMSAEIAIAFKNWCDWRGYVNTGDGLYEIDGGGEYIEHSKAYDQFSTEKNLKEKEASNGK